MQKADLEKLLKQSVLVADGATGTMLMAAGLPAGRPPEAWNVDQPQQVIQLHTAYIEAGSQIILTNTFGGSRTKLEKAGCGNRTVEFNRAAAALARQSVAGKTTLAGPVLIAGDIGPTGEMMDPFGSLTYATALDVFKEQAAALAEGGADFIWVETMSDLEEARAAVTAANQSTGLPVFCSLSFTGRGRTMMGLTARQAVEELWPLGLSAFGANCGQGLDVVAPVLQQVAELLPNAPLIAKPNAGLPKVVDGQTIYDTSPSEFAERILEFSRLGARVVGACCGSGPAFISEIRKRLDG